MRANLVNARPKDCSRDDFIKMWNNAGYTLEALKNVIEAAVKSNEGVSSVDFDCPNHYAKLAYKEGKLAAYREILEYMPNDKDS